VVLWAGFWHERLHRRQFETMGDLEAARAAAEQASQAKTRFLASASHDLRQPIHALGLHVHALKGWIRYPEVVVVLAQIESAVRAMEGMFNSLLDLTRLTSGAVKPEMASVPVIELQLELESMFGAPARDKGLDLRMHPCRLQVRSDPVLLRQILRNLVANAVRYTERGAVLVGCRRRGNALRIEVWDTGPGIGEDEQDAVFVEFVRLGRQGRKDDRGLGIGLTIAREAAQMLGHDLRVRSRIGRGSCFAIGVPLAEGAADVERARIDAVDSLRGAFVVVIEDDEEVLDAMRALLRSWGCHAILAVSAADARTQLARHQRIPDLIVCDYDLAGGETALDAVDGIREEDWPQVPVLVVTGTALASSAPEMARRGYPVMRKPIAPERLQQAMSRAMRSTG
jgi:CheY-like chemotaxis protein